MYTKHQWEDAHHFNFKYVQYLPKDYDPTQTYPLVFFLHGAGERGDDLDLAVNNSFMRHTREEGKEYPFIFVAPQCPHNKYWGCYTESLLAFLEYICTILPVDRNRIYLTGLSMGGTGTWMLAMAAPSMFAAVVPVCGSGIYWYGEVLVNTPVRMYHGDCDNIVPIQESISMLNSINKRGGHAELTICYGMGHDAWDVAYAGDELVDWMMEKRLGQAKS